MFFEILIEIGKIIRLVKVCDRVFFKILNIGVEYEVLKVKSFEWC